MSGPDAIAIADRVFEGGVRLAGAPPRTVQLGRVVARSGRWIDEVLATVFISPHSYTGEDMVELSCHGGPLPAALVLEALIESGARPAGPGEFTKRAFLSGKMDLSQAEAVAQIVSAKSRAGLRAALAQSEGALSRKIRSFREALVAALAELEARLDFSEDVEEDVDPAAIAEVVSETSAGLEELLRSRELGRLASEGARVVIAGRPNVGKSRLLNALVGKERAIVTPVPGTTRDTIEEWVELDGVLLTLADTAGLRPAADLVEAEGVRRTRELLRDCQLVLMVVELTSPPESAQDPALIRETAAEAPVIPVVNKCDLEGDRSGWSAALERLAPAVAGTVLPAAYTSALTGEGVPELKARIVESLVGGQGAGAIDSGEVLLANARHAASLTKARDALGRLSAALAQGLSEELLAFEMGQALGALGEVTGESIAEDVLENIFSRFCIGK